MKKTVLFLLVIALVLAFSACSKKETEAPETEAPETTNETTTEMTMEEVYELGKNFSALLGDHESLYIVVADDGTVLKEDYYTKEYLYSFTDEEYLEMGFDYESFISNRAEYVFCEDIYMLNVQLLTSGIFNMNERFASKGTAAFIASPTSDDTIVVKEADGSILVTRISDNENGWMGDDIVSCEETYTIDATTREMTAIKTVYTFKDGSTEEGVVTITRDVEAPEKVNKYLEYDKQTDNMRTITFVSNPGTENEKTETVQAIKGMAVAFSPYWEVEETLNIYTDVACTQLFEEDNLESDITLYLKWEKQEA